MATGDNLLEAVTADTLANELKRARRHSLPVGTPCANCAAPLNGPWCHVCGQRGEEFHRSIWKLMWEAVEGLTDLDGRMWKTLPRLILRPGKLTREYLEGRRASQIPPFRMFLIVLLLVFFAGGLVVERNKDHLKVNNPDAAAALGKSMSPADKADFDKSMAAVKTELAKDPATAKAVDDARQKAAAKSSANPKADAQTAKRLAYWKDKIQRAMKNPDALYLAMQEWGHRFAVLMLPIAALMLTGLFAFRKGVYVFDHLIFAMHSLSFVGLLLSAIFLASLWAAGAWWALWAAPVHLFIHMRGTYGTGVLGTLWRMWWLFIATFVVVILLIAGLVLVGLASAY